MTDISHIVTNGCSFTYGAELEDPVNQAWPAIVAKKLNVPIVNIARPSIGNDAICRRTYEYFYEDLKNDNNPLYIIGFSAVTRKEYWNEKNKRYDGIHINKKNQKSFSSLDYAHKDYLENYDYEDFYRRNMLHRSSLRNLFNSHNIPYIFVSMMSDYKEKITEIEIHNAKKSIKNKFSSYIDYVHDDLNDLKSLENIMSTDNFSFLPEGHYDANTNKYIGENITSAILKRYQFAVINDKSFLTLSEFTRNVEKQYNMEWAEGFADAWQK